MLSARSGKSSFLDRRIQQINNLKTKLVLNTPAKSKVPSSKKDDDQNSCSKQSESSQFDIKPVNLDEQSYSNSMHNADIAT
jgi:hypothetical protein